MYAHCPGTLYALTLTFRFLVAFSQFVCLPSDTSKRVFLALEISAGWHELQALTEALNKRLYELFRARPYYTEARFHASIGFWESHDIDQHCLIGHGHKVASTLNITFGDMLRRVDPTCISHVAAQVGSYLQQFSL